MSNHAILNFDGILFTFANIHSAPCLRSAVSISLLMLLLYHTGRVWFVLLCFESNFPTASPVTKGDEWRVVKMPVSLPYTVNWQIREGREGLMRVGDQFYNITQQRYENDTLYTVLKTNLGAREHFFALADEIKQSLDRKATRKDAPKNPLKQLLKSLNQCANVYLPFFAGNLFNRGTFTVLESSQNSSFLPFFPAVYLLVPTPPPR